MVLFGGYIPASLWRLRAVSAADTYITWVLEKEEARENNDSHILQCAWFSYKLAQLLNVGSPPINRNDNMAEYPVLAGSV